MLNRGWGIRCQALTYEPVGFGSHHWSATQTGGERVFATLDLLDRTDLTRVEQRSRLDAAMRTAAVLAERLSFVVAPRPTIDGMLLVDLGPTAALAVFSALTVTKIGDPVAEQPEVVELLVALHSETAAAREVARVDDLILAEREHLAAVLDGAVEYSGAGPYAEPARLLISSADPAIRAAIRRYDELVPRLADRSPSWVITHGEPHPGNVLITADGLRLVDWDTALLAPAARDLAAFSAKSVDHYRQASNRSVPADELEFYRLRWDLREVANYVGWFSRPHAQTPDTEIGWQGLAEAVEFLRLRAID